MVIALLALGLVMILGGVAAVVQGFPYVRLESGLAMVIGGSTAASAGAVVLGLSAIVLRMKQLESAIAARFSAQGAPVDRDRVLADPLFNEQPVTTAAFVDAGLGGARAGEQIASKPAEADAPPVADVEPWLPGMQREPELSSEAVPAPGLPNRTEAERGSEAEVSLRPSLDDDAPLAPQAIESSADLHHAGTAETEADQAAREQAKAEPASPDRPPEASRDVIGTYSSGGNTYVMFADGTIEAETPRGRFNFNSLEELKDFVDSGGEYESRGAA